MPIRWLVLPALLLMSYLTLAAPLPAPVAITANESRPLNNHLQYLVDVHDDLRPETLLRGAHDEDFRPLFGRTMPSREHWVWLRFSIINPAQYDQQLVLSLNDVLFEQAELLYQRDDAMVRLHLGLNQPFAERTLKHRIMAFPLIARSGQTTTYYLGLRSHHLPLLAPSVSSAWHFVEQDDLRLSTLAIGVMLGMLCCLLLLATLTHNLRRSLLLALIMLGLVAESLLLEGDIHRWFSTLALELKPLFVYQISIIQVAVILFARQLLDRGDEPGWLRGFWYLLLGLALTPSLIILALDFKSAIEVQRVVAPLVITLLPVYGAWHWYQGKAAARLMTVAILLYALFSVIAVIAAAGLLPYSSLLRQSYHLGALLLSLMLSLALAAQRYGVYQQRQARHLAASQAQSDAISKGHLLARMSHEIRTPINSMLGIAQLLQSSPLNTSQKTQVYTLMNSAILLLDVVNEILDMARMSSGRMTLEQKPFNLDYVLGQAIALFMPIAQNKGITLTAEVAPNTPLALIGDRVRLQQIINSLISNAIKCSREARLHLRISHKDMDGTRIQLTLEAWDGGHGISSLEQRALFEAFDGQGESRLNTVGLGLSISRQLARLMGGDITINTHTGRGSVFRFEALLLRDVAGQREMESLERRLAGVRVIVAISDASYRDALSKLLAHRGMKHTAVDGPDSLRQALANRRDDVLLISGDMLADLDAKALDDADIKVVVMHSTLDRADALTLNQSRSVRLPAPCSISDILRAIARQVSSTDRQQDTLAQLRVLVAEDNAVNQQVVVAMLKNFGIAAEVVDNGRDALTQATREDLHYDLILMDCEMPEMDGWEATRAIRQHPRGRNVAIVALTAHALPEDRERCMTAGMNEVLVKPLLLAALEALLRSVAENRLQNQSTTES